MSAGLADRVIDKLMAIKDKPVGTSAGLGQSDILQLCRAARQAFLGEPSLLEVKAPITICGDLHGQYHDLLRIFDKCGLPPATTYLFLGDYVDRGAQSIETVSLLFALKVKFPDHVFMLRGNHECCHVNKTYGFYDECLRFYSVTIWRVFTDVFKCLPIAAVVGGKIFCVHGGISPKLTTLDAIRQVQRPIEISENGMLSDLLWSDPSPALKDEKFKQNERGMGYQFSCEAADEFIQQHNFQVICRSHQAAKDGYEFPFAPSQNLLTIFSAPNYCYQYQNVGAVVHIADDENLTASFTMFDPVTFTFAEGCQVKVTDPNFTMPSLMRP